MSVEAALRDAGIAPADRDARGLMPVELARSVLAGATVVTRDTVDRIWAAMVSLVTGDELAQRAAHLDWQMPVRGHDNVALVERYGAGALAWLATRERRGVLVNHPWCVVPSLLAIGDAAALELLLEVGGVAADGGSMAMYEFTPAAASDADALQAAAFDLVLAWARRYPDVAAEVLARRAPTTPRAADALRAITAGAKLDAAAMLARLDAAAADSRFPCFVMNVDGRTEYFGLRVIGVRAATGDGWAIVFERLQGCDPYALGVFRHAFGPGTCDGFDVDQVAQLDGVFTIEATGGRGDDAPVFAGSVARGPAGELALDESVFARFDVRPGKSCEAGGWAARTLSIRAYLEAYPGSLWPPPADALAIANVAGGEVLVASTAFHHEQDVPPSQQDVYRSLVDALIARDASRFRPGESNLDWRLHANEDDGFELPWTQSRADTAGGFVAAAMADAGVAGGAMAVADARAVLAEVPRLARGDGRYVGDGDARTWVWDLDRAWAALLSLGDAADAAAAFATLELVDPPRGGVANLALAERYGDGALAVLATRKRDGVLVAPAWLRGTLLALASPAAWRFAWDLDGLVEPGATGTPPEQATALFAAWMTAHPEVGYGELARLALAAEPSSPVARQYLVAWGRPQVRRVLRFARAAVGAAAADALFGELGMSVAVVAPQILDALDAHAKRAGDRDDPWPQAITGAGPSRELHAMRLVAARRPASDDWAIVVERFEGYGRSCAVRRYVYRDDGATGLVPALDVAVPLDARLNGVTPRGGDELLAEQPDYFTQSDRAVDRIARIRALLRDDPSAIWPTAAETLAAVGFAGVAPLVVTTQFAHAAGATELPSAHGAYATIAATLVNGP